MVHGGCCCINGAGSVRLNLQARHASGHLHMWVPWVFCCMRDAHSHWRPPMWYLSLRLKPDHRAMVSAMVAPWELRKSGMKWAGLSHPAQCRVSASEEKAERMPKWQKRGFSLHLRRVEMCPFVFECYWSCSKLSAVTWEGSMTCICSADFKVSQHSKGLMEGKGEPGKRNWRLGGWQTIFYIQ